MGKIYKSAADLIGNTPLVEVGHIEEKFGLKARVLVKLEYFNATGSVKDRVAKAMIEEIKRGKVFLSPVQQLLSLHQAIQESDLLPLQQQRATEQ